MPFPLPSMNLNTGSELSIPLFNWHDSQDSKYRARRPRQSAGQLTGSVLLQLSPSGEASQPSLHVHAGSPQGPGSGLPSWAWLHWAGLSILGCLPIYQTPPTEKWSSCDHFGERTARHCPLLLPVGFAATGTTRLVDARVAAPPNRLCELSCARRHEGQVHHCPTCTTREITKCVKSSANMNQVRIKRAKNQIFVCLPHREERASPTVNP